jgi:hypothetical protein
MSYLYDASHIRARSRFIVQSTSFLTPFISLRRTFIPYSTDDDWAAQIQRPESSQSVCPGVQQPVGQQCKPFSAQQNEVQPAG